MPLVIEEINAVNAAPAIVRLNGVSPPRPREPKKYTAIALIAAPAKAYQV